MDISVEGAVQAVLAQRQEALRDQVRLLVLKKELDAQAQTARQLLEAVPAPTAPLASSGTLGRNIDVLA